MKRLNVVWVVRVIVLGVGFGLGWWWVAWDGALICMGLAAGILWFSS